MSQATQLEQPELDATTNSTRATRSNTKKTLNYTIKNFMAQSTKLEQQKQL